jgi:hypothetical protein
VPLAYDPALSISSVTVNENSPYAVFTVSGLAGQLATLSLTGDSGDTAALAALQYYDPSANAGAGAGSITPPATSSASAAAAICSCVWR